MTAIPPEIEAELSGSTMPDEDAVRCGACETPVARRQDLVEYRGRFLHTFRNPSGFVFDLLLFGESLCHPVGQPTVEYSWFPGYAWQVACCPGCGLQLGWVYSGGDGGFFGFIRDRLSQVTLPI